jgi:hypothetical protein
LRGSLKDRLEIGAQAVQNGLMSRNEWRQLENLPPVEGADILTAQVNLAPVGSLGQAPSPVEALERMANTQDYMSKQIQDLQNNKQPINVSVNPEMTFQTPEVRVNMDISKPNVKSSKSIKLLRDEKGNLLGAESVEG